jgi:membrane protein implicated in regulation of membrane protease activity
MERYTKAKKNLERLALFIIVISISGLVQITIDEFNKTASGEGIFAIVLIVPLFISLGFYLLIKANTILGGIISFILGILLLPLVALPGVGILCLLISLFIIVNSITYIKELKETQDINLNAYLNEKDLEYEEALKKLKEERDKYYEKI